MSNKIVAIVQARMGSTRLPGKVLKEINGKPLIEILLNRLSQSKKINKIIIATSEGKENELLVKAVENLGYEVFRGSENDVLDRYYQAAKLHKADIIIRITGDCPLVDADLVDEMINIYLSKGVDLLWNDAPPTFPDGLDVEIFSIDVLKNAWENTKKDYDREHVTPYITNSGLFNISTFKNDIDYSNERWTVDEPEDLSVIKKIVNYFHPNIDFGWQEVIELSKSRPEMFKENKKFIRNEGAELGTGQKLWKRARRIIPGGNMLLSKRAEMFLPEYWPAYFSKSKGCIVWDMDGNKYIDMSIMGIGTNTLGYGHPDVDQAVNKVIELGNMSTFNCPEEVYLAERLVEMHPWSEMVRFARTGGEAASIAIRIARAASGKDKVAFCGYHGWHDWYIASNLSNDKSLDGHLLPGLEPKGVPRALKNSVIPFHYNQIDELEDIIKNDSIGVICMEVARDKKINKIFLRKVRKLADQHNIVLIFDEISSGFRQTFGGLHLESDIEPDLAIFGKALGNGYPITSIIGKRSVMDSAQSTFISSTFWTDRIGPVAALKTMEVMQKMNSWETITSIGRKIQILWKELADRHNLDIEIYGIPAITSFSIKSDHSLEYKTLITQEMLKKGYLASNIIFTCIDHTDDIIENYINELDRIFGLINNCENGQPIGDLLKGPTCHSGFKRLN